MTKKRAKALSLEVWGYLAEHPELDSKWQLPYHLHKKISRYIFECPLCELFFNVEKIQCYGCPLKHCRKGSPYYKWSSANEKSFRRRFAQQIVNIIQAWEVG